MSISNKIRSALSLGNKKQIELSEYLGKSEQTINYKFIKESWTASDLIRVAELTGSKLAYIFPDGTQVVFSVADANPTHP
jgi:hypothetical protein